MQVTFGQIVDSSEHLKVLLDLNCLPFDKALRLADFALSVDPKVKAWEQVRMSLFKKYGEEKEGQITIRPECLIEFSEEMEKLKGESVEVQDFRLTKEDLADAKLSVRAVIALRWLID